jgi:DNA-binding MarR family transcriptional regulator
MNQDNTILKIIKEYNRITIKELHAQLDCTQPHLNAAITRLKKRGEVYDPFLTKKNEGKYVKVI